VLHEAGKKMETGTPGDLGDGLERGVDTLLKVALQNKERGKREQT